jgi:protein-S-isoprenylcysteine O-methyltransferase Ste14
MESLRMRKSTLLPPVYFYGLGGLAVALHFLVPVARVFPSPWRFAGLLPMVLGGWITVWADRLFKRAGTTVKPFVAPSILVTEGPFRISRHPMYLGMLLFLVGLAVLAGSLTPFASPLAFFIAMEVVFLPQEERNMEDAFGRSYSDYRRKVRRWI